MSPVIDLNADLGESYGPWPMGDDAAMLDIVTSANIACGFHAGDPEIMVKTVALCRKRMSASARTRASTTCTASAAGASTAPRPPRWRPC